MPSGSLVNIDYGEWFPGVPHCGEPWGLEGRVRRAKTARGYFKQQMIADLLARPGRQDLTADVDFAALDLHGRRQGFESVLLTTLAAFLRAVGREPNWRRCGEEGLRPRRRSRWRSTIPWRPTDRRPCSRTFWTNAILDWRSR